MMDHAAIARSPEPATGLLAQEKARSLHFRLPTHNMPQATVLPQRLVSRLDLSKWCCATEESIREVWQSIEGR